MSLNFNISPYYDDFDPIKNYHRVLFKPGAAVQARELTQSQTLLQNQISSFAANIFKQNTPVSGGQVTVNLKTNYIKLNFEYQGINVTAANFLNKTIQDATRGVLAKVIATSEGVIDGDPPSLFVTYLSGVQFQDGDTIYPTDGSNFGAVVKNSTTNDSSTGPASTASIASGVFYVVNGYSQSSTLNADNTYSKYSIGNFVQVNPQTIVLDKYDSDPSYRVGLQITETIIDYVNDPTLLDPAIGASNYQAPGADRYQINLALISLPLGIGNDDAFIELVRIEKGNIVKQVDGTVYSIIDDYFAKRTSETNGDYIVNNFKLTPSANTVSQDSYDLSVSKGVAYVRGYRVESQSDLTLTGNRARTTSSINNNNVLIDYGNFLYVNTVKGSSSASFDVTTMPSIDLHVVNKANVNSTNTTTYTSTLVGTAKIRNLNYDHYNDTSANTESYVYKASLFDVQTNTLSDTATAGSLNTITFPATAGKFSTANGAYIGVTITIDSGTSSGDSRKIVDYNGVTRVATVDQNWSVTPTTSSQFTLRFRSSDIETLALVNTSHALLATAAVDNTSKKSGIASGATILQDGAYPELLFKIGNPYVSSLTNSSYYTQKLFRTKSFSNVSGSAKLQLSFSEGEANILNFEGRTGSNLSASEIQDLFTITVKNPGTNIGLSAGDILDFTSAGRTVTISSDKNTVTFQADDLSTTLTVDVLAKVFVTDANNSNHVLKNKRLITTNQSDVFTTGTTVNTNTFVDLTNAQVYISKAGIVSAGSKQSLYVSDVKRIVKIIDTGAPGTPANIGMLTNSVYDVTSYYSFNNGQNDNYYDHAFITLKPGAPSAKGNLLVLFDYYLHGGGDGYFSVMSYLSPASSSPESYASIPNYTAKNGIVYPLRDSLDFRPSRVNATSTFTFEYTSDPTLSDAGVYLPDTLTSYVSDYTYYLAKKDLVVLTKDKKFQVIEGVPSINPTFPTQPDGSLLIAQVSLDPYTAYIPGENPTGTLPNLSLQTIQHKRWTMQDISDMQTRVNNLEYYTSLNLLEQKASSLQVPDVNGINRFKNGILVDDFSSFSTADTYNPDFSASINKRTRQLTAAQTITNFPLFSREIVNSNGSLLTHPTGYAINSVNKTTNIFTLPYTTANVVTQQLASSVINVNPFAVSIYQGTLDLNPPMDNWVDNTKAPDLLIVDPSLQVFQQSNAVNLLNTGDWKVVPGTTTTSVSQLSSSFSRVNHGAFNGPFGNIVGYTQTDTSTTTSTYGTLSQTNTLGAYTSIGNTYSLNNNYITDISILPYIRPQQILIRGKGLLVNSPVSTWFDGVKVDEYMSNPDVIELTNVTGNFSEGDTIGYYENSRFFPIATVVSMYNYPNTSRTRLYVTGNFHTSYGADLPINRIQNAFFNGSGVYQGTTASGQITSSKIVSVHKSGYVGAVGGTFTDVLGTSLRYYRVWTGGYFGPAVAAWGIWGNPQGRGAPYGIPYGKFNFTAPYTGTYYMRWVNDDDQYGFLKINGVAIAGGGTVGSPALLAGWGGDYVITLNKGVNTFEIYSTTSDDDGDAFLGCAISTAPWENQGAYGTQGAYNMAPVTTGQIVLSTDALVGYTTPLNAGTQIEMPGGGLYYVGATKFALNGIANSTDGYYNGSKISINSVYISIDAFGKSTVTPQVFTANVVSYTASDCTVTLDAPVNISVGGNAIIGGSDTTSFYTINGTQTNYQLGVTNDGPSKLSTDETGTFVGVFNIPQGVFKTGQRVFRVDNRLVDNDPTTATTYCEATFTASGLSTKSQSLDFGASVSGAKNTFTQTNYLSNQLINQTTNTVRSYQPYDPVAQTFIISKDNYPNGLFLNSISVFFKTKPTSTSTPITLSIVGTQNGYPNGETLDYSIVTLTPEQINVSDNPQYLDENAKTTFKFPAPVYLQSGVLYAFILKTPSTEYTVYYAGQNGTAIPSSVKAKPTDVTPTVITKIGNNPYVGSLFESQNGITWTADQTKSLMMVFDRCVFSTTSSTIPFVIPTKLPYRRGNLDNIRYFLDANTVPNFMNTYAGKDVDMDALNITTTDFTPTNTGISYTYNATLKNGYNKVGDIYVTPGKFGSPTYDDIYLSDGQGERVLLANTNDSFLLDATLTTDDSSVSPIIADDGLTLYNVQWNINNLEFSNSQIILLSGGSGYNTPSPNANVIVSAPDVAGGTQALAAADVVDGVVTSVYLINPGSGYLNTPTISISGANSTPASVSVLSELSPHGGNAYCKYFTKKVVLTPGNDSQDLRVYYTAYRPNNTNIYVFYKLLNTNDTTKFDDNNWQLMTTIGDNKNAYSTTRDDLYEFEAAPGTNGIADNQISYTNPSGQTYNSFIQFAIKVVITTSDKTTVPFLTDIRALALPSGTGI
jgi:hypothetical protein